MPEVLLRVSPWIEWRRRPIEEIREALEAQTHRRFLKTHLPLDGLPYHANVRYICVSRDPRDVFMSFLNHYGNYTDDLMARLNDRQIRHASTIVSA